MKWNQGIEQKSQFLFGPIIVSKHKLSCQLTWTHKRAALEAHVKVSLCPLKAQLAQSRCQEGGVNLPGRSIHDAPLNTPCTSSGESQPRPKGGLACAEEGHPVDKGHLIWWEWPSKERTADKTEEKGKSAWTAWPRAAVQALSMARIHR